MFIIIIEFIKERYFLPVQQVTKAFGLLYNNYCNRNRRFSFLKNDSFFIRCQSS